MRTRALILAAGRGSRMGSATDHNPKCLTLLKEKSLLQWQLESLQKAGIADITVVRGYKSEMLSGDFSVVENSRWAQTNMVASLFCAPSFNGNTIMSYSDIVYHPDHIMALVNNAEVFDISITADVLWYKLWKQRFEKPLDDAETFKSEKGILTEIGNKTQNIENIEAQYMGLIKFTKNGWQKAFEVYKALSEERQDKMDMTSLLALMLHVTKISVITVKGKWCEVDNYNDVVIYETALEEPSQWSHNWQ